MTFESFKLRNTEAQERILDNLCLDLEDTSDVSSKWREAKKSLYLKRLNALVA